jgi:hypothetical protein
MHYDYVVILKRENARKTDLVSFLLLIFSAGAFSVAIVRYGFTAYRLTATFLVIFGLGLNLWAQSKKKDMHFRAWLFAAGILWIGMPYLSWLVIPFFLLAFLEIQAKYPLEIGFYSQGVVIISLFRKQFPWSSFQTVLLKDGMLTLDFRNNKLFQKEVLDDDDPDAAEDEFNDYCRGKLVNLQP